jgi:hypothetical protein
MRASQDLRSYLRRVFTQGTRFFLMMLRASCLSVGILRFAWTSSPTDHPNPWPQILASVPIGLGIQLVNMQGLVCTPLNCCLTPQASIWRVMSCIIALLVAHNFCGGGRFMVSSKKVITSTVQQWSRDGNSENLWIHEVRDTANESNAII